MIFLDKVLKFDYREIFLKEHLLFQKQTYCLFHQIFQLFLSAFHQGKLVFLMIVSAQYFLSIGKTQQILPKLIQSHLDLAFYLGA